MKKVLALVVAAAMGLSSVAFAADAASATPGRSCQPYHRSLHKKHHKAAAKPAAEQKAQAAKKHS